MERDGGSVKCDGNVLDFNSHAHVERDGSLCPFQDTRCNFNSHAHVERDRQEMKKLYMNLHFNSHAHVERDSIGIRKGYKYTISTHTLTWSVTLDVVYIWCLLNVMRTYFFI